MNKKVILVKTRRNERVAQEIGVVQDIILNLDGVMSKVSEITFYKKNIYATKHFSFGTWTSRQHVIVKVEADSEMGFGECVISVNQPTVSLSAFREKAEKLANRMVSEALKDNRQARGVWPEPFVEMMEMALIDLIGKLKKKSAVSLLGLRGKTPVHGVYVILSDNLTEVEEKTNWAIAHQRQRFIKVKLFGDNQLDCAIIETVRRCLGDKQCYLIGDVNGGYRKQEEKQSLTEIATQLKRLYQAGLDACEDPAYISHEEWVALQTLVGRLNLIPDYPLRPSRESINQILPGMGRIYNIHPDSAGSLIDAVALAERVRQLGAELMIGDDSLVGPAATVWQQLAIGLGASWVEATEKEQESDFYYSTVKSIPTDSQINPIKMADCVGFGIYLDEKLLAKTADQMLNVKMESFNG